MIRKIKVPTCTTLVMNALLSADDFLTAKRLQEATLLDSNHVSAALFHLRKRKAIDCLASDGQLWWFATPETDDRSCTCDERTPESKPRNRRSKKKPTDES